MAITRSEFKSTLTKMVSEFADTYSGFADNPQIRVNPALGIVDMVQGHDLLADIADSQEAVENDAAAETDRSEDVGDFQSAQDPDYYSMREFILNKDGQPAVNYAAIDRLTDKYFPA